MGRTLIKKEQSHSSTSLLFNGAVSSMRLLLTCLLSVQAAQADSVYWNGSADGNWFKSANWDSGVPGASDSAIIDGPVTTTISGAGLAGVTSVQLGKTVAGASLIINGGSSLTATGQSANESTAGYGAGSSGSIMVTGAGSSATFGELELGYKGSGALTVTQGAVTTTGVLLGAHSTGGLADIVVSGSGSRLTATNGILLGDGGLGSTSRVTLQTGGTLESEMGLYLFGGSTATASGTGTQLLVGTAHTGTPDDFVSADGWLMLGHSSLTVSDGARVEADGVYIKGEDQGGDALMTLTGAGTTLDGHLVIYVGGDGNGNGGNGTLTISDGATATATIFGTALDSGSTGRLELTGKGSALNTVAHGSFLGNAYAGAYGDGMIVVQNGAEMHVANELRIGYYGGTGKLVIGALEGQAAAAPGTVTALHGIVFGVGTGEIVFNHTASDYVFTPSISGNGIIKILAGTTTLTGDSSHFTGLLDSTGGILRVSGSIGAVAQVGNGATLTGSGTVGGVNALSGATIAPGNSPGTLTVNGNYQQASGSVYNAELFPGSAVSDLIAVSGTATLNDGAILNVIKYGSGAFTPDARYLILTATGGITGTYTLTGDTAISAFYSLLPDYDATGLWLEATQTRSFESAAVTPNQRAVAGVLDGMSSNAVRTAVAGVSTDAGAQHAYDQLSGEVYASTKTVLLDDSRFVRQATSRQLDTESENPVWIQAYGDWNDLEGDGNTAGVRRNTGGLFIGTDGRLADVFRLGVVSGYGHSTVRAGDGRGNVKVDTYSLGVYGGEQWRAFRLGLGLDQAWHQLSSSRNVAFNGFSDALSADYRGRTTQAWGDAGYRFTAGGVAIEPFAGLAYVYLNTPGFSESGGAAALHLRGDDTQVTFSTLGVKSNAAFDVRGTALKASGLVGWRHSLDAVTPSETSRFADGSNFGVAGIPVARDVAVVEAGVDIATGKNSSLGIHYSGQLGSGTSDNGVRVMYGIQF